MKKNIILSAALMFFGLTASAQTTITFDSEDYKKISVYDSWEESPFRTGVLAGNAAVADNPDTAVDEVLGSAPNATGKVVALQRSRHGSNTFGVRIDLKEPFRMTKQQQYIHVMAYLKDKPTDSRMMVIGLGKRIEESWNWQTGEEEQFWALTTGNVKPKEGWQDIVVSFKGFSYSKEENEGSGIDIYSLVIVPDVRSPHADQSDWVAYFDEIVVDNSPEKRFSTDKYALTHGEDAAQTRGDRHLDRVGLTVDGTAYSSAAASKKLYTDNTTSNVFPATAGAEVQPTFGYTGAWMSGYVYVDWGNDGVFKATVNNDGTPAEGSDIVSYNAAQIGDTWYKSDGTTTSNGNTIGAGVPKFTVPANTPVGFYRMRYKVDWNSIDPAGAEDIVSNGGGILDLMLDVHGDKVTVNASQLNGDIVLAADESALQNYTTAYGAPLTVKIVPAPGFVQYGFTLKYGYNVNATEQLDDNGNPNWIKVDVPFSAIAADGTYAIPAEYMRGSHVSIVGDMQQVQQYTVKVVGGNGNGGVVYANVEYRDGDVINATQYMSPEQVEAIAVDDCAATITVEGGVITVTYTEDLAPKVVTAINPNKHYTLECRSANAHNTERFISDDGTVINGRSSEPTYLVFEPGEIDGTYYIKSVVSGKYINHDGSNIFASTTKSTAWTLGVPTHTANVVTFGLSGDKYLNNNGSDCTDGSCTNLKGNYHAGGPGSGNACSLWEMYEYSVNTSIAPTHGNRPLASIYDLMGRRVEKMEKGVYIVDGKKVLRR